MKPILFSVGSFPVRAYGVLLLLGLVAGILVLRQGWKEAGLRTGSIYGYCAGVILSALVGGPLGYALLHLADYAADPGRLLGLWKEGGGAAWGAMAALLAWSWLYSRRLPVGPAGFLDLLVPALALTEGIMRWGCLLNGCCYGREVAGFPGLFLPDLNGHWAVRYPTQILYSALGLGLFALLWAGRRRKPFAGFLALTYLILYTAGRLGIGFLRGDYVEPASRSAFLGVDLALLVVGAGLMAWQVGRSRKSKEGAS